MKSSENASLPDVLSQLHSYYDTSQVAFEALSKATSCYLDFKNNNGVISPRYVVTPLSGSLSADLFSYKETDDLDETPTKQEITEENPFIAQSFKWISSVSGLSNGILFEGVVNKENLSYGRLKLPLASLAVTKIVEKQGDNVLSVWTGQKLSRPNNQLNMFTDSDISN